MLKVQEQHVGYDLEKNGQDNPFEKGYLLGEPQEFQPFTENKGQLFRTYQREYGRCYGHVYQDTPDGTADAIGWVFRKKQKYEDVDKYYIHEVWVTLRDVKA